MSSLDSLARSMLRAPWQLSSEGVHLASGMLSSLAAGPSDESCSEGRATQSLAESVGQLVLGSFLAAQELGREIASNPLQPLQDAGRLAADSLAGCQPGQGGVLQLREYANKVEVFFLVLGVPQVLGLPATAPFPSLAEIVEKAYSHPPYPALWLVEGSGSYYADTFWAQCQTPQQILKPRNLRGVPFKSRLMLNAGLGLSLAKRLGKGLDFDSPAQVRRMIEEFLALVNSNSTPGSKGAALESLGLVTRMGVFTQDTDPVAATDAVSRQLKPIDQDAWTYFWHGAGRSLYFNPVNFVPGHTSFWQAIEMLVRQTPEGIARLSAMAGYSWAVTLVNLRQPAIMAQFLNRYSQSLPNPEAFSYGIMTSIIMRFDTTPDDPAIEAFCSYRPECGDPSIWERMVSQPCRTGLKDYYPVLKRYNQLGQIFRYQPLGRLVQRLRRSGGRI